MPRPLFRAAALTTAFVLSLSAAAAAAPAAGAAGPGAGAAGPGVARQVGQATATRLVLLNGDRVLAGTGPRGGGTMSVLPAPGDSALTSSAMTLTLGSRIYLIPTVALPYLGRGLDPSLFDTAALRHAERSGRLPVVLRYHGRVPALPGLRITHAGAGTATGYLTAASAARFGAALARQLLADHPRASYGTDGLFAGGVSVSLPGARPAPARHAFPMHTLTVTGTDAAGRPDTGDVVNVLNVTDLGLFGFPPAGQSVFDHGTAKFSVPSGTYWSYAIFLSGGQIRLAIQPQFSVTRNATVHLDAAAASRITMATPRPSVSKLSMITVLRTAPKAVAELLYWVSGHGSLWVTPSSRKATVGALQTYTAGQFASPLGRSAVPYVYNLDFPGPPGIIPPQHFAARPAGLATVSERYYQELPTGGDWGTLGGTAHQLETVIEALEQPYQLRPPQRQVQYFSASPATLWFTGYSEFDRNNPGRTSGGQNENWRLLRAGQRVTDDWNRFPLHPAPNGSLTTSPAVFPTLPSAFRAGNSLSLDITPFSDNQPGHLGSGFFVIPAKVSDLTGSYALYQNGTKLAGGNAVKAARFNGDLHVHATLSPKPSVITFMLTASRASQPYRLSATSQDVWTWRSRPEPGATVPAGWYCKASFVHGQLVFDRHCAAQQMLTLRYLVAGLSLSGSTAPGRQAVAIAAAPAPPAGPVPVATARVQVSFDRGATWQPASVRHHAGAPGFTAGFSAPAGHQVSLRVSIATRAGATLTETILGAYQTTS